MQIIAKLSDMIEEELGDSEKYIKCAMDHKTDDPALAQAFAKLSTEELGHAMVLHEQVVRLINDYKKVNGDPPEKMQWIYDYLHKKHIERENALKVLQAQFKG